MPVMDSNLKFLQQMVEEQHASRGIVQQTLQGRDAADLEQGAAEFALEFVLKYLKRQVAGGMQYLQAVVCFALLAVLPLAHAEKIDFFSGKQIITQEQRDLNRERSLAFRWEDIPPDVQGKIIHLKRSFEQSSEAGRLYGQLYSLYVSIRAPFDDVIKMQIARAGGQITAVSKRTYHHDGHDYFALRIYARAVDPILDIAALESVRQITGRRYVSEAKKGDGEWESYRGSN